MASEFAAYLHPKKENDTVVFIPWNCHKSWTTLASFRM